MLDGTYTFEIETPLGRKRGTVALRTNGDALFADIDAPVIGKKRIEGIALGDTFTARGSMKILLVGTVDFTARGEVAGDVLHVAVESSKGGFRIDGQRVR